MYWSRLLVMDTINLARSSLNTKGNLLTQRLRNPSGDFRHSWTQKLNYFIRVLSFLTSAISNLYLLFNFCGFFGGEDACRDAECHILAACEVSRVAVLNARFIPRVRCG